MEVYRKVYIKLMRFTHVIYTETSKKIVDDLLKCQEMKQEDIIQNIFIRYLSNLHKILRNTCPKYVTQPLIWNLRTSL